MNLAINQLLKSLAKELRADFVCLVKQSDTLEIVNYFEQDYSLSQFKANIVSTKISDVDALGRFFVQEKGKSTFYKALSADPQMFLFLISSNQIDSLIVEDYFKSIKDVFSAKSKLNGDLFSLFAQNTEEILFKLDEFGKFTYVNSKGESQLKYTTDEIVEKHFLELISDNKKTEVSNVFQQIIQTKQIVEFESGLIPKVGFEDTFHIKLIPIIEFDKITQLFGIAHNKSELNKEKKRNEELNAKLTEAVRLNTIERERAKQQISVLSELNNLKNDFISNVSHEFRTPLASIIGFAETIIDDKNLDVKVAKEFSEVILAESKRLAKLIDDILDFSELENKQQSLNKSSINLINILNESADKFEKPCKEKNITLTRELPNSEVTIYADYERLSKVFNYLLSNAVKFTNSNGRIKVIAQEFLKEVDIIISDTGIGIPEEKIPLLFNKFSKVKREGKNLPGAGFGLLTIKQIVSLHDGIIRVKSQVNKGTSFIIKLPKYSFN